MLLGRRHHIETALWTKKHINGRRFLFSNLASHLILFLYREAVKQTPNSFLIFVGPLYFPEQKLKMIYLFQPRTIQFIGLDKKSRWQFLYRHSAPLLTKR